MVDDRRDKPALDRYRDGDVRAREKLDMFVMPRRVHLWNGVKRLRRRHHDHVVDRDLLALCHGLVNLKTGRQQIIGLAIHRQIEMRRGPLRFLKSLGDHLAHRAVRDKLAIATLRGGLPGDAAGEAVLAAIHDSTSLRRIRPLVRTR